MQGLPKESFQFSINGLNLEGKRKGVASGFTLRPIQLDMSAFSKKK
jgi:hypothetical protein